jgi:outer membrane receptor for ferrienterochelin and colicins
MGALLAREALVAVLLSLGLLSGGAAADEGGDLLSLVEEGTTVEAASRHPQSLTDAPAHVTIVTRQEIEECGYETIGEAISSAAGFYLRDDRNYTYLGVRGFAPFGDYGSHVLLMIDGHPMIEPIFSSSFFERNFPIDLRCVQRIEIVRGPASALYGTNAVLAVANVITVKPTEAGAISLGAGARTSKGWDLFLSPGLVGKRGLQAKISATMADDQGFDYYYREFDQPATNYGWARDLDGERGWSVYGQMKRYGWSMLGLLASRTKAIPTASWGSSFGDERLQTEDAVGFLDSRYDLRLGAATSLSGRLTLDWYSYEGVWPSQEDGALTVIEDPHSSKVLSGEVMLSSGALRSHQVTAGLCMKQVLSAKLAGHQTLPEYYEYVNMEETGHVASVFAQDEIASGGRRVSAVLGLRYDHYRDQGDVLNPRLGLILRSRIGATKLLYGSGFRAPTLYELYYDDTGGECAAGTSMANPDLDSERAYTCEVVHEADLGRTTRATVSAFYYKLRGMIEELELAGGCLTSVNSGTYRSRGLEAEVHGVAAGGVRWFLSYALTDTRNRDTGSRLAASPGNLAVGRVVVPVFGPRVSLGVAAQYVGRRLTKSGVDLEPVLITNATLYLRQVAPGLSLSVAGKNIFDEDHLEPAGPEHVQESLPQAGRSVVAKVSWEL